MAIDYPQFAQDIIERVGGNENISLVQHCMTRLRFNVNDINKADQNALKQLQNVLGVQYKGGQLQVILGKNLIPTYDEVIRITGKEGAVIDENLDDAKVSKEKESIPQRLLAYIAGSVTPMIPGIIAGGMLKVFLVLFEYVIPGFTDTSTYLLLDILSEVPFFFIPVWVAYGAAKRLGSTPIYAMVIAGMLVMPDFLNLVKAGDPITLFTLSVPLANCFPHCSRPIWPIMWKSS